MLVTIANIIVVIPSNDSGSNNPIPSWSLLGSGGDNSATQFAAAATVTAPHFPQEVHP